MSASRSVELLEGNDTIRRLMAAALEDAGIQANIATADELPERLSDVLVADVDSGVDADRRIATYVEDHRAVVYCGLRDSRSEYGGEHWVQRPFTPNAFLATCMEALGLEPQMVLQDSAPTPPAGNMRAAREPITREIEYDEAQELEERMGLDTGVLSANVEATVSDEEAFEVLDIDDSAIVVVDHLKFALGGRLHGGVDVRRVQTQEIDAARAIEVVPRSRRSRSFNQTMPETPLALGEANSESSSVRDAQQTATGAPPQPGQPARTDDSAIEGVSASSQTELAAQIHAVARMLAESWERIALTSRTQDRADRIERILTAAVGKGLRGASEETQRIPVATGFAGSLLALTFVEVVRTIRDRRLRGRLEVAISDDAYVLYFDSMYLQEIDTLSGNVDDMLLDILHQGGAIDQRTYDDLVSKWKSGQFNGPLELALAREKLVADATLQSARIVRAREIFRRLCSSRGGQFAFLEIRVGDGQPWPVDPLRVNVDQLMLELLRESSIDTGDSQATASTHLQLDPNRAAAIEQARLTEEERSVMNFFRDGETLDAARQRLQKQAGPEDVDRIVDRLKKVELLKRSDPHIGVPQPVSEAVRDSQVETEDLLEREPEDEEPGFDETARLAPDDALLAEDEASHAEDEALRAEDATHETAKLKRSDSLIGDTRELDRLIEAGIAAYESEASDQPPDGSEGEED